MITIDNTLGKNTLKILKNPITSLIIALLSSIYFYYISLSNKTPAYFITVPELIAQKADEKLRIFYDNTELENVYSSELILWNDGDKFIDYSDFIKNKPIKLYSTDSINILSVSISKVSRDDLKFRTIIIKDTVNIFLRDEEALEEGDGVKFLLLFTIVSKGVINPKFELESRIKGTQKGFLYKDLAIYKPNESKLSLYFLWGIIIFFISFRIIILFLYKKPIVFRNVEAVIIFSLILITSYLTIKHVFYTANLNWL
ncbi:hypothetical protein [Sphingobacterium sp. BN32]|uniref:hypothetical protein n=1 Tax=Sphingobacterium sp. BN32 TaxID=3058432 RepID=UPI00265CEBDA|nr:hypothetical protein [Sphingobacterium sp. BN32]WKK58552.1 hypothetical protein QYC40_18175 [Sphingobacterium sp. BN32]